MCYKTIDTEPFERLIYEDLAESNFVMLKHREESVQASHINLVMAALGKFHALSSAVKDQQTEKFKAIISGMNDGAFASTNNSSTKPSIICTRSPIHSTMNNSLMKWKNCTLAISLKIFMLVLGMNWLNRHADVVCHADDWNNNLMFQLNENHKPLEVRILYKRLDMDHRCWIFCFSFSVVRRKKCVLNTYHSSLSEHLAR